MQNQNSLVSIVVPAYNAASYIEETIQSILGQTYPSWETIIVNDGSTDTTPALLGSINDGRFRVINQENAGVSSARNNGLTHAGGEFIVFFDADDVMTPDFIAERVKALKNDTSVGFVGGSVETFPVAEGIRKAVASDPVNEILFFDSSSVTIPSNYMFRKNILTDNGITFNQQLSSTADRFFILEVSKFAKGINLAGDKGRLLYRVTPQSMSNNLSPRLIIDNEKFYYELKKRNFVPAGRKREFKSIYFMSLAKGFGIVKAWRRVFKYLAMSFINHPLYFLKNLGRRSMSGSRNKTLKVSL